MSQNSRSFRVPGDVDAEPLELVGLIPGTDAEHQRPFDNASASRFQQRAGPGCTGAHHDRRAEAICLVIDAQCDTINGDAHRQ